MTLTDMRYLVALAREKHFGRAAEVCHVSQPTLSIAVKKVESELAVQLFERVSTEVRLTAVGNEIVEQSKKVLQEAKRLSEIASQGRDPLKGILRVGAIYTVAPYLLPKLVPTIHRLAPEMPLYLREDFTANLIPALNAGELDVVLLALPFTSSGAVSMALYDEPFRLMVPADHPWQVAPSAEDLEPDQMILLGQGNCFRDQILEACPQLNAPRSWDGLLEGGSLETLRYMVASGTGIAVMPSSVADPLVEKEPLVRILQFPNTSPKRRIAMAWRVTFARRRALDVVRQAIVDCELPGVELLI